MWILVISSHDLACESRSSNGLRRYPRSPWTVVIAPALDGVLAGLGASHEPWLHARMQARCRARPEDEQAQGLTIDRQLPATVRLSATKQETMGSVESQRWPGGHDGAEGGRLIGELGQDVRCHGHGDAYGEPASAAFASAECSQH